MELHRRVEQISALVAQLRQAAGDGPKTRELLDSIFRSVHTFKAAAAAEGHDDLKRIAHELEDLLHSLRTGRLTVDADVLHVLDETVDALRDRSEASSLTRLTKLAADPNRPTDQLLPEFSYLKEDERHRALSALHEGAKLYVLEAVFEASDFDERFRQLRERLKKIAELISTSAAMKDDKIIFQVVYACDSEKIRVHTIVQQAILAGNATAETLGKELQFVVKGDELLLDKPFAEALADALLHLVRNAVDHGIETHGRVLIEVSEEEVSVTDDGRGIAPENLPLIFQPGFSTAKDISNFSGRGVGLDAVKIAVESFGGSVSVTSKPAKGSSFKIKLPNPA